LGYNPIRTLLGPAIGRVPAGKVGYLTGRSFFPKLISGPFHHGLAEAFTFALLACLVAAIASWLRGGKYHYGDGARVVSSADAAKLPVDAAGTAVAEGDGAGDLTAAHATASRDT
jgi:hypothetical protein